MVIDYNELANIREEKKDKKIAFCSGCFDILHSGHAVFFSQCKEFADILVVGLGSDKIIKTLKGGSRPIIPEKNRLFLLASLKNVDYVVLADEDLKPGKIHFTELLEKLRPNIFVLNDDDSSIKEKKALADKLKIELKLVPRMVPNYLKATSSTKIINKIKTN